MYGVRCDYMNEFIRIYTIFAHSYLLLEEILSYLRFSSYALWMQMSGFNVRETFIILSTAC